MNIQHTIEMQDATQQAASAVNISGVASKLSIFSGAGTVFLGTMTSEFLLAVVGAIGTIGTLLVNIYYKRRADKLEQRRMELAHELAMRAEERKRIESEVRMEVMRDGGTLIPPMLESMPAFLTTLLKNGEDNAK